MASPPNKDVKKRPVFVIARFYSELSTVLESFPDVLYDSISEKCLQDSLIDVHTLSAIINSNPKDGTSMLLDQLHAKLEQSEAYLPQILNILREDVHMSDVVNKIETFLDESAKNNVPISTPKDYNVSLLPIWANRVSTLQYDVIPVYRTIEHFSVHKRNEAVLFTEPFYTSQGGYKLALCVYPNGFGSVKGTYLSVFAGLMKGENDQSLPFPFSGIIVIKLLNWMQDAKHVEDSLPFDEATLVKYREQLTTGQMITGPGYDILPHTKLMEESSDHQYLYEDKLCFQILFEPIQQTGSPVPSWCDEMTAKSATLPCTRTLYSYAAYKKTSRVWASQPFYSAEKGYKLRLQILPHIDGTCGILLLKGEHDDSLKWPLTVNITLQLLNWKEDNNHLERTIYHDTAPEEACKRVTQGNEAPGWLWYNPQLITDYVLSVNNGETEYVRDGKLCFRIINVDVL